MNKNYNNNLHASVKTLMQALHVYICKTKVIEIKAKLNVFSFHRIKVKRVTKTHQIKHQKGKKRTKDERLIDTDETQLNRMRKLTCCNAEMAVWIREKKNDFCCSKRKRKEKDLSGEWSLRA